MRRQAFCIDFAHGGVAKLISNTARIAALDPEDRQKTIDLLVDIWHGPSQAAIALSISLSAPCRSLTWCSLCAGKKNGKKNYEKYLVVFVGTLKTMLRQLSAAAETLRFDLTTDYLLRQFAAAREKLRVPFDACTSAFAEGAAALEADGEADFPMHASEGFRGLAQTLNAMPGAANAGLARSRVTGESYTPTGIY